MQIISERDIIILQKGNKIKRYKVIEEGIIKVKR